MRREVNVRAAYFGKLPARGDFVRASDDHQLIGWLDRWAGQSMALLSQDPDWKRVYDQATGLDYAFLGSRSRTVLAGHVYPSCDASQRRFPLLSAVRLDTLDPLGFMGRAPLALARIWSDLARLTAQAVAHSDPAPTLAAMAEGWFAIETDPVAYADAFADFLQRQTLAGLQALLRRPGHEGPPLHRLLVGVGLLLQPVLVGGHVSIDKALEFPLPGEPTYRPLVACWWLDLVTGFLGRGDYELALLLRGGSAPSLLIGFNGADPRVLQAALAPPQVGDYLVRIQAAEWVEGYLHADYQLHRLTSYLERGDLALATARQLFVETFLGA